jgi:hypothetical protein
MSGLENNHIRGKGLPSGISDRAQRLIDILKDRDEKGQMFTLETIVWQLIEDRNFEIAYQYAQKEIDIARRQDDLLGEYHGWKMMGTVANNEHNGPELKRIIPRVITACQAAFSDPQCRDDEVWKKQALDNISFWQKWAEDLENGIYNW